MIGLAETDRTCPPASWLRVTAIGQPLRALLSGIPGVRRLIELGLADIRVSSLSDEWIREHEREERKHQGTC